MGRKSVHSDIAERKTGHRSSGQPTINDVAALAGVSKKTVSRVINRSPLLSDSTRTKVQDAVRELGFVPNQQARALALRRNFMIVLLHDNPNAQTVLNFQKGILQAMTDSDLALVVRPVDRSSPDMLHDVRTFLEKQRPLGAMLLPPISENDDLAALCKELGVRYVRVGSALLDDEAHCVTSNDRGVVAQACEYLIKAGHRKIGFVRGPQGFRSAKERESGFLDAIKAAGINHIAEYNVEGTYRFDSGKAAAKSLMALDDPPTAILASNDEMAAGVMHALHDMKIAVPGEVSVVGFDDSPTASHIWPALTTVRWPIVEMGSLAVRKMVPEFLAEAEDGLTDKDRPAEGSIVSSQFITRDSVAPPKEE